MKTSYREICSNGCGKGAGHAGECDSVPTYHGEPAPELSKAIWAEAEKRYSDGPMQSAFNDGCHWLIQRVKAALAELQRLDALGKRMAPWTDKAAFLEYNDKVTAAYRTATNALAELVGDHAIESLWYLAPEANDDDPASSFLEEE